MSQANQVTFRNYLLFWSGQLVSLLGSSVAQFVIIWWITLETGSPLYLSIASFLGLMPMVALAPFTGALADRWNRKALMGIVDLLQALATIAIIALFWLGSASLWVIMALLTLRGIFQAFHSPAASAITPLMVPQDKLSRMNGLNYLLSGAVTLVGPVAAATLLEVWKYRIDQILWIDATTFVVAVIPLLIIHIPSVRMKHETSSFKHDISEGFSFIKGAKGLLPLLLLATALNFLLTPLSTLLPYFVKFEHLGGAPDWAIVLVAFQGGILGGGLLMSLMKGFKNRMSAILASVYAIFIGYAIVSLTPTGMFLFMALGSLVMAFCVPVANVSTITIIQTVVPLKMQGRVNSVTGALASAATPLGMILSGVIVEFTRTANLFLACSIIGIILLTLSWFSTDIRHVEEIGQTNSSENRDETKETLEK